MLQNASLLAIVAVHTAENEPSEVADVIMAPPPVPRRRGGRGGGGEGLSRAVYSTPGGGGWLAGSRQAPQTLEGSFSAVWTATIARLGSFFSIFRDLQYVHTFAPLRFRKFSKKKPNFLPE